ncbi:hypothetical protein EYF88_02850 [Paracoccus sediminis]|uniref:Uncharacterized protein n=1 Tax=Paracoccus sediminis TaxID=1214787 RepID=A0A238UL88_9RHOB|nr:hypothetical protein [Paracoccus sediminis]TBN53149.1 hypothetical protein EYF88_02850 [Paracoccus sediminis]SNR22795.1 hypothetical protein SAMN06265378_10154 [Paracoccus sediminis]
MLQFDVAKWRNLGLDAELAALLAACVNAANRTPKAGRGIRSMTADPGGGMRVLMTDGSEILLNEIRASLAEADEAAIAAARDAAAAVDEALADLPLSIMDLDIEDGRLIKILGDGSRVIGPILTVGGGSPVPVWDVSGGAGAITIFAMPPVARLGGSGGVGSITITED